jgi:hypothetical protein
MEYLVYALFPQDFSSFTQGFMLTLTCFGIVFAARLIKEYHSLKRDKTEKLIINRLQINLKEHKSEEKSAEKQKQTIKEKKLSK